MVWAELNFFLRSSDICHRNYCTNICNSVFSSFEVQFCHEGGLSGGRYFTRKGLFVHHPKLCLLLKPPSMYLFERFPKVLTNFFFEIIFELMRGGGAEKWAKIGCLLYHFFMLRNPKGKPDSTPESFRIFHISTEEQPAVYSSVFRNWKQWKQLWEAFKCTLNNLIVKLDNIYIFVDPFWRLWSLCCTVISVNMPTPHFYRKYAHPFFEGSFLKILW